MQVTESAPSTSSLSLSVPASKLLVGFVIAILGVGMGFLISREEWLYALILALAAPFAILMVARPFVGVILWLLLMPFVSALPNTEIMYWAIHRFLVVFTLALVVIQYLLNTGRQPAIRLGPPELAMGILAGLVPILIILFQSDNRWTPLIRYADRILIPFCLYLVVRLTILREWELRLLEWTALLIVISQAAIGFMSWFAPGLLPAAWQFMTGYYTSGSLANPNVYAAMLVFCAAFLMHAAMQRPPGLIRLLFLSAFVLSVLCIFLSLERAAWLAGALFVLGLLVVYPKTTLRMVILGGIGMVILGGGLLSTQMTRAAARIGEQDQIDARIVVSDAMLQMIQLKPWLGWGFETLNQNIQDFYRQVGNAVIVRGLTTSHNTYLTILTELGLVGLVLYLFPVIWWLWMTWRVRRWIPREGLGGWSLLAVLWLALLSIFIINNFMDMRWFPIGITLWWMTLGLIANLVYPYTRLSNQRSSRLVRQDVRALQSPGSELPSEKDFV